MLCSQNKNITVRGELLLFTMPEIDIGIFVSFFIIIFEDNNNKEIEVTNISHK